MMRQNMFVGRPPGNYDRLLDFSRAVTGNLFFAPSATFLENLSEGSSAPLAIATSPEKANPLSPPYLRDTSLGIGSLKGEKDE